jgi:hypothetical protein
MLLLLKNKAMLWHMFFPFLSGCQTLISLKGQKNVKAIYDFSDEMCSVFIGWYYPEPDLLHLSASSLLDYRRSLML